ncbi:GAF domain-containing protein [Nakamurella leprariae]|uniref:GAF domain-containing protein n=1 Tax=Nakamurella leprariae TaxID=2803911 RepID=A0A938Y819_9ACTN|nr:GAF domain-containing protein [Nakamurella leprariae]
MAVGPELLQRWPGYGSVAVDVGIHRVTAVPLLSRGQCWGVLDLYRRQPEPLDATQLERAQLLADVAVSFLVMAHDRQKARAAQHILANRLLHDELTGLPNRVLVHEFITHALTSAERHGTLGGGPVRRHRPFQGHQRHLRAPDR